MRDALIIWGWRFRHAADRYQFVTGFIVGAALGYYAGLDP